MSDVRLQRALTQIKTDLGVIVHEIEEWAGKPNKPPQATGKINSIIQALDSIWNVVFKKNQLNYHAQDCITRWVQFKQEWKSGHGSWKQCEPVIKNVAYSVRAYTLQ